MRKTIISILSLCIITSTAFALPRNTEVYKTVESEVYADCRKDGDSISECKCVAKCITDGLEDTMSDDEAEALGFKCGFKCAE